MVALQLRNAGINAVAYHAGLKPENRDAIQHQFMNDDVHCIVATIAFGMGVDKSNIRRVIHFDLPKSIENYSQERSAEQAEMVNLQHVFFSPTSMDSVR